MEKLSKCPNCGKLLTESELYCWFCEFEIRKIGGKSADFSSKEDKKGKN